MSELAQVTNGDFSVAQVLSAVCRAARSLGADAADVMLMDSTRLRLAHGDPESVIPLANLQEQSQRGPCRECITSEIPVAVNDLSTQLTWSEMRPIAAEAGLNSVLSAPLLAQGRPWGALDVYRRSATPWHAEQVAWITVLARMTANHLAADAQEGVSRSRQLDLEHRATHDELTELPTRAVLVDRLEHALLKAERYRQKIAVLFIDVDDFKEINDAHGHAAGDAVLVEVARRLERVVRRSDSLARWSGDEFVVVSEGTSDQSEDLLTHAVSLGERIHQQIGTPITVGGLDRSLSVSIGVVVTGGSVGSGSRRARGIIAAADRGMYAAKGSGGGRTSIATPGA